MRRALLAGCWLVLLPLATLAVLCALRVSLPIPFDWLWAFVPELFVPAWLMVVVALVTGARSLFVGAALVAAAHLALLLPAMTGEPAPPPPGTTSVRVVTANVLFGNEGLSDLLDELAAADADVLALQEVTPAVVGALNDAFAELPHREVMALDGARGGAVFSRVPLRDVEVHEIAGMSLQAMTLDLGDDDVRLWNVHTIAPNAPGRRRQRDDQMAGMATLRTTTALPLVAAGDYNATLWHPSLRELLDADLDDAASRVGRGLATTWKGAPVLESGIDHVLVSGDVGVAGVEIGEGPGSDHRPVVADLWVG